jgi:hypothetical protein
MLQCFAVPFWPVPTRACVTAQEVAMPLTGFSYIEK